MGGGCQYRRPTLRRRRRNRGRRGQRNGVGQRSYRQRALMVKSAGGHRRLGEFRTAAAAIAILISGSLCQAGETTTPPQKVTGPEISILVRSTVLALHQANMTGNYSVLRDLGDS